MHIARAPRRARELKRTHARPVEPSRRRARRLSDDDRDLRRVRERGGEHRGEAHRGGREPRADGLAPHLVVRLRELLAALDQAAGLVAVGAAAGEGRRLTGRLQDTCPDVLATSGPLLRLRALCLRRLQQHFRVALLLEFVIGLELVQDPGVPHCMQVLWLVMCEALLNMDLVAAPVARPSHVQGLVDVSHEVDEELERDGPLLLGEAAILQPVRVVQDGACNTYIFLTITVVVEGAYLVGKVDEVEPLGPMECVLFPDDVGPRGDVLERRPVEQAGGLRQCALAEQVTGHTPADPMPLGPPCIGG
mmetsp:Transcript_36543/g.102095  ORF Transcript_36543/g.102095 Transcript_36543/m.102095 type:complete len:306 (-) Transcript_36543:115-1032(-)